MRQAASEDRPFFAYISFTAAHAPATPAERHENAFFEEKAPHAPSFDEEDVSDKPSQIQGAKRISDKAASNIDARHRKRLHSMLAVDEMVGTLLEELEEAGELDNSFIFFTSDNGFHQGEHRIRRDKNQPYEESARVSFFVRGPRVAAGAKAENLALNTDLAPTFADLAGVEFPADGRSLAPLLSGEADPSWRTSVLLEKLAQKNSGEDSNEEGSKAKTRASKGLQARPAFEPLGLRPTSTLKRQRREGTL